MADEFKVSQNMKKKELIDEYERLLSEFKKKSREADEARTRQREIEKKDTEHALEAARETTIEGVITNLGQLRGQVGKTLNDVTEKMTTQAERLIELDLAIVSREKRLEELDDLGVATDTLAKLTRAYEERQRDTISELDETKQAMIREHEEKKRALEQELEEQRRELTEELESTESALTYEMKKKQEAWKIEKSRTEAELKETAEQLAKEREREEAEYTYERDRLRKLEQHQHEEKKAAVEKMLVEMKEETVRELAVRTKSIEAREQTLEDLRAQVETFPAQLEEKVEVVRRGVEEKVTQEAAHKAELIAVKHEWTGKMLKEKIDHLEDAIASRDVKLAELKAQLDSALIQVQKIAEKTVEGASMTKAFTTVNEIAMEQARRPEISQKTS